MTYNMFGGTLSLTQSINQSTKHLVIDSWHNMHIFVYTWNSLLFVYCHHWECISYNVMKVTISGTTQTM